MTLTEINKQELEAKLAEPLADMDYYNASDVRFGYTQCLDKVYVSMEFDSSVEMMSTMRLDATKRNYRSLGYKVEAVLIYPKLDGTLSFSIMFEI